MVRFARHDASGGFSIDPTARADPNGFWAASIWPIWVEWAPDLEPFQRFLAEHRACT